MVGGWCIFGQVLEAACKHFTQGTTEDHTHVRLRWSPLVHIDAAAEVAGSGSKRRISTQDKTVDRK